jgi:outer membrane beta-barrel protein
VLSPYLNGSFVKLSKPERIFEAFDPARPGERLAQSGWSKELVSPLTQGMREAHEKFLKKDFAERLHLVQSYVNALKSDSATLKLLMMKELARSRQAVEEEWSLCTQLFEILPGFCKESLSEKTEESGWSWSYAPVGLCLLSANVALPVYSLLSAALPALVAGNAVCLRPSLQCPLSGQWLAQKAQLVNFPAGLFQVVFGDLEVYRRLVLSHQFDCVLYTGGEESLEQIRRDLSTNQNTRMVLCGGGKNAALVLPSANIEKASEDVLYGATVDCGQRLESTGLVFVQEKILDAFQDALVRRVKEMPIGVKSSMEDAHKHVMGPLCSANSWERYLRFQGIAARESADTLRWGKPIDNPGNGYFVSPGVHLMPADKVLGSVYATNSFFGPDVCLIPFEETHEAVDILNAMKASRVLAVHSEFEEEVRMVRRTSQVPTVTWNAPTTQMEPHLPTVGRGRAGNSYVTGVRFLFNSVFPQTLNLTARKVAQAAKNTLLWLVFAAAALSGLASQNAYADYKKAVEGNDVVKGKFYPKAGRFQLNVGGGGILNQSFIDTYLIQVGATYHLNEWHALNVEGFFGISKDQTARTCVENFYADTERSKRYDPSGSPECGPVANPSKDNLNTPADPAIDDEVYPPSSKPAEREKAKTRLPLARKPAYMAIRELNNMAMLNYQWTPVYGKALWFLSAVGYLDLYANVGLGLAMSNYYPEQSTFPDGKPATDGTINPDWYGLEGRPKPEAQTSPTIGLGFGSRFFFAKHFMFNVDLRNFTIIAETGDSGFYNVLALYGGLGFLF